MTDVEGVRNLVGTGLVQLVGGTLTAVISLFLLIRISPTMTLFVLVPVAVFAVIALKAFGKIRPIFRERGKLNAEVSGRLTETLNGVRVIKGFNAEEQENRVFEDGARKLFENVEVKPYCHRTCNQLLYFSSWTCEYRYHGHWGIPDHSRRDDSWGLHCLYPFTLHF